MDIKQTDALKYAEQVGRGRQAKELIRALQLEADAERAHRQRRHAANAAMYALTEGDDKLKLSLQKIGDLAGKPKQTIKNRIAGHRNALEVAQ